ncbi:MAG: hypothetical protein ABEJ65_00350, partial [bacterium]
MFFIALVAFSLPLLINEIYTIDFWKALYTGRYIVYEGSLPNHSVFTYSPVQSHLLRNSFTWLGNTLLYGVFALAGYGGLQALRVFIVGVMMIVMLALQKFRCNVINLLGLLILLFGVFLKLQIRTPIFILLFMPVVLFTWYHARYEGHSLLIYILPVLFFLWGNMHANYLTGFGILFLAMSGDLIDRIWCYDQFNGYWCKRYGAVLLFIILAVTFVKPFPDYKLLGTAERIVTSGGSALITLPSIGRKNTSDNQDNGETWYSTTKGTLQNTVVNIESRPASEYSFPFDEWLWSDFLLLIPIV